MLVKTFCSNYYYQVMLETLQNFSDLNYCCVQWWNERLYLPLCWGSLPSCLQITYFGDGRHHEQPSHVSFM